MGPGLNLAARQLLRDVSLALGESTALPSDQRCRALSMAARNDVQFSKFSGPTVRFNTLVARKVAAEFQQEAQEAIRQAVQSISAPPLPFQKEIDGVASTVFNPQAPTMNWLAMTTAIRAVRGVTTVFGPSDDTDCPPQNKMSTAPRRNMWAEKKQFLSRLVAERNVLALQVAKESHSSRKELLEVMEDVADLVMKTPIYEVDACPKDGIPAYFIEHGPRAGITFAKGAYSFNLLFHELGHRLQVNDANATRYFVSHSSDGESRTVDARHVKTATDYLWREEEVYQWNVAYILFKVGYSDSERSGLEQALAQVRRLQEVGPMLSWDCDVLAGKLPQAYDQVLQLFQRIQKIPDFSKEEIKSALALVTAYFNIDITQEGVIRIENGQLPRLLGQFYHAHLTLK